jgi:hypothetical protein
MKCVYLEKECKLWVAGKRRKGYRHVTMVIKELGALSTRKSTYFGGKGQGHE